MDTEQAALLTLGVSLVVLAAVIGVRLAARFGLPGLLLYLGLGLFLGRDGFTHITFDDPELASTLGYAALVIILAEGGLTTRPSTVRPVIRSPGPRTGRPPMPATRPSVRRSRWRTGRSCCRR